MTDSPLTPFTPQAMMPGQTSEMREGRCILWYDGPACLWLHGPPGDILVFMIHPDEALSSEYMGVHLGRRERMLYTAGAADMRTLISVPEARLFAVDFTPADGRWFATRIEGPLPDQHLPEPGIMHADFPILDADDPV